MKSTKIGIGSYIVRTERESGTRAAIGNIMKINGDGHGWNYAAGWSIRKTHCRAATEIEIMAYKKGIKNINDPRFVDLKARETMDYGLF